MLRLGFIIGLMAIIGLVLSGLVAMKVYDQELSLGRSDLARAVDTHASLVQERLSERELLARVAVGLFRSPSTNMANALQPLRSSIYAFKTDFLVASWVARIPRADFGRAQNELKAAGFPNPTIRNFNDTPLNPEAVPDPATVVMDVEPQNDETKTFGGRMLNNHPVIAPMFNRAVEEDRPVSSDPFVLLRTGGPMGIVLASPVRADTSPTVAGFLTISYRLAPLMLTNEELSLFSVALRDPRNASDNLTADAEGNVKSVPLKLDADNPPLLRVVSFGARDWTLIYYAKTNAATRAQELAGIVMLIGAALTLIFCGLFGYVSYNNIRLSREIQTRIDFERRLTAVIDELNHRVKNILAVIQSIVTRTMRHGADIDVARELLIGRIHAMSHVVSLLSESQWQGVKLKGLFESRAIPHADRIALTGPDITVSARAAQSLSLLFFELASHADEGLSLVGKHPHIVAGWTVSDEPDPVFHFRWEEFNTSAATRRADSEFGLVLLDRVAPEALGGTSKRYFTDVSYVYELTAPMATVVDEAEMDRTERIAKPVKKKR
ncbi:MAG TPA: histidine kinase [Afipia sp.]|uniref:CHASE domain-containing protein n=1 Tax=unclassified Afipia TaxID=2642050 RepID=UPI0004642DDC|nr:MULTISPECIES: HWE histidine kinase domain-containing protein [unclassified Afipia]MAH69550.1 histidine kinase [Afipia sp.]OUX61535.1 MAG: histidine kinase [Afipia sp. TMED4]HAO44202.1 histidine kinase [Afipia sp.]HAP12602.1 histidine kinase [Afipia sp.]HAQ94581.1 histidine kinase [Afipia sp.]